MFTYTVDPADNTAPTVAPKFAIDYSQITPEYVEETLHDWNNEFDRKFPAICNPGMIDRAVNLLYSSIRNCVAAKAVQGKRFTNRPDWWTDEVERHRKVYLKKKSLFYKNRHPEYANYIHAEMRAARDRINRKLAVARQKSWDRFIQQDLAENPWGVTYKLSAEKFHKSGVLSCLTRDDNTATLTPNDTLDFLLQRLLPDDDPSTNTRTQQDVLRNFVAIAPLTHEAEPFAAEDLDRLVHELRPNKAPGHDQLAGGFVKLMHPWTGRSLLKIYNACWKLGYFPKTWKTGNPVILLKDPADYLQAA
jgi:hypothetical protein